MSTHYTKSTGVADRRVINEHVLVPIRGDLPNLDSLFTLNPTASTIYDQACKGLSETEMVAYLLDEFDVKKEQAQEDTHKLLGELIEIGALERIEQ